MDHPLFSKWIDGLDLLQTVNTQETLRPETGSINACGPNNGLGPFDPHALLPKGGRLRSNTNSTHTRQCDVWIRGVNALGPYLNN